MGHNSANAATESVQEMVEAPHTEVTKAAIRGETQDVGGVAGKRLRAFIDRVQRVEEEIAELRSDVRNIYAEAKSVGFDPKIIRRVVTLEKMDPEKRREEEELLDLYKSAVGMV